MYRNNPGVRDAWHKFIDNLCGDSTNWFCAHRNDDITWLAIAIVVFFAVVLTVLYLRDRNKIKKLEKQHNMELDPLILDIYSSIKNTTHTIDTEAILDDLCAQYPKLKAERVEECIRQLKKIGYLSKEGVPIT